MIITKDFLVKHEACPEGVESFLKVFPSGSADTQNAEDRKKAIDNLLDQADWLVDKFVPYAARQPHWEAYKAAVRPHAEAYDAALQLLWEVYQAAVRSHREAYKASKQPFLEAYAAAVRPHREAYEAAERPLLEAYHAVVRPLRETYFNSCLKEI